MAERIIQGKPDKSQQRYLIFQPQIMLMSGYQKYLWGWKPKEEIVQPHLFAELVFQNIFGFLFKT